METPAEAFNAASEEEQEAALELLDLPDVNEFDLNLILFWPALLQDMLNENGHKGNIWLERHVHR